MRSQESWFAYIIEFQYALSGKKRRLNCNVEHEFGKMTTFSRLRTHVNSSILVYRETIFK